MIKDLLQIAWDIVNDEGGLIYLSLENKELTFREFCYQ